MKCSYSCSNYDYLFSFRTVDLNNPFNYQFTIPPDIDIKYLENAVFTVGFDVIPVSMYMYVYHYKQEADYLFLLVVSSQWLSALFI